MSSRPRRKKPDDIKFRELVLFICARSEGDSAFGATKLNKLLFFADFIAYLKLGKAISGQSYQKLEWGPAPRYLIPTLRKMREEGEIAETTRNHFGKEQHRAIALREADLDYFTAEEVALITEIIEHCWEKNANEVSGISHQFLGWQAAADREDIPYETILLTKPELNKQAARTGRKLESLARECQSRHGKRAKRG